MKSNGLRARPGRWVAIAFALGSLLPPFGSVHAALAGGLRKPPTAVTLGGALPAPLPLFPGDNWWNLDITNAPVDSNSAAFISFINNGGNRRLHPDFGGEESPGSTAIYGFPYVVVDSTQPKKTVQFGPEADDESDGVDHNTNTSFPFYPIPDEAITQAHYVEGGAPGNVDERNNSDRHLLIVDRDNKFLYELYNVFHDGSTWRAYSGAFFDMKTNNRRPDTWTSADAAGLAILPGLVRYDEVYGAGEIKHAFRVTVRASNGYVYPASHAAGSNPQALPMGARLRLKAGTDISGYDPAIQKIFRAMKKYGLIVADNGSDMYISGTFNTLWDNDILNPAFHSLHASDFEVIQRGYNPPPPQVRAESVRVVEADAGQPAVRVRLLLSAPWPADVTVSYATANGTATTPGDYVAQSGTATFLPGETSKDIFIPIVGDAAPEATETFTLNLSNPVSATLGGAGTIEILDTDGATLVIDDAQATEGYTGTTPVKVAVRRLGPTAGTSTVNWATAVGTAGAADFVAASGSLTFDPGDTQKFISLQVNGDITAEPNEQFTVTLSGPVGATIGDGTGTITILNDEGTTISVMNPVVTEGNSGSPVLTFTVILSATSASPVSVKYATEDGTAVSGSDYTAMAGTLTIPAGAASLAVSVPVIPDALVEPNEVMYLNLSNATGATIFDNQGMGTIVADDGLLVSIGDKTSGEGNSGTVPISFNVTLNQAPVSTVTVDWTTADGTATAPLDYQAASGTVTFNSGETSKTITVQIVGDSLEEPYETFFVNLSNPTGGASIGDGQGQGTITNTDGTTDRSRLMFHNFVTNRLYRWHMKNGNTLDTYNWVTPWATDPGWTVGAVADFDQDGQLDYLWHNVNAGDGRLLLWYIDGDNLKGYQFLPYTMLPPWRVATTFDGNGDGAVDIVYYNSTTGVVQVKTHDNAVLLSTYNLNTTLPGNLTRRVVAAVDANGDGDDELALYNSATGQIQAWDVSGSTVTGTITYPTSQSTAQAFTLVSTKTDFNDDGRPDLLWHNPTPTGVFSVWFMTGTTRDAVGQFLPFTATDPVWRVVGSANVW
ncbi:MAG: hypothetical protein K1Y01_06865 [Vicinamibacteria bacterium]|nr:hypothetical protein [Vicinamibacteria bacterium]